jgi:hypothetical protein
MKKIFPVVLVSVILGCVCCKKSGTTEKPPIDNTNNLAEKIMMHATINGKEWKTDSAFAYRIKNSGNDSGRIDVMISAAKKMDNPVTTITFNVSYFTGQGVYPIDPPNVSATYYVGSKRYLATSGEIVFKNDTGETLRGTFTFKADTIDVTNGTFTVAMP